ncbi:hypothetical protein [Aquabacterium sp.]
MLTLAILCLVTIPVLIDLGLRGRHQTIELSMLHAGPLLDKSPKT